MCECVDVAMAFVKVHVFWEPGSSSCNFHRLACEQVQSTEYVVYIQIFCVRRSRRFDHWRGADLVFVVKLYCWYLDFSIHFKTMYRVLSGRLNSALFARQ